MLKDVSFTVQRGEVVALLGQSGAGKSTAARVFTTTLNTNLYKILYVHFSSGSALDLLRQIALELDLEPAHLRGDLVRQIAAIPGVSSLSMTTNGVLLKKLAQPLKAAGLQRVPADTAQSGWAEELRSHSDTRAVLPRVLPMLI